MRWNKLADWEIRALARRGLSQADYEKADGEVRRALLRQPATWLDMSRRLGGNLVGVLLGVALLSAFVPIGIGVIVMLVIGGGLCAHLVRPVDAEFVRASALEARRRVGLPARLSALKDIAKAIRISHSDRQA